MVRPNQLSDEALAVLREFARAGSRKSGSAMTLSSIERSWKKSQGDLEVGLADLETARLVVRSADEASRVFVTTEGEAFFARYFWSCY